jgi:hypothetical protein
MGFDKPVLSSAEGLSPNGTIHFRSPALCLSKGARA